MIMIVLIDCLLMTWMTCSLFIRNIHYKQTTWYNLGKVKFGFWRKMYNYPVLQQQSYFSIRPLDIAEILRGVSWHVFLPWVKISAQLEFGKTSQYGSIEVVRILLFTSFWLVNFLFGKDPFPIRIWQLVLGIS